MGSAWQSVATHILLEKYMQSNNVPKMDEESSKPANDLKSSLNTSPSETNQLREDQVQNAVLFLSHPKVGLFFAQ
jgi:hypothetical protein